MKPSTVEPGQVWLLEEVGTAAYSHEARFKGLFLVTQVTMLASASRRHSLGEPYTTQAFGLRLDGDGDALGVLSDGLACLDYVVPLLHTGDRINEDSCFRWRYIQ